MPEMRVAIDGNVATVAGSTGVGGTAGNPGFTSIVQGGNTANVAVPGPNLGAGLVVSTGTLIASTTLNALSASGPGVVADFGSAKANVSMVFSPAGTITAGAVALEVSHDNITWWRTGTPVTLATGVIGNIAVSGNAFRYARANITTAVTGTAATVSATLMAS